MMSEYAYELELEMEEAIEMEKELLGIDEYANDEY